MGAIFSIFRNHKAKIFVYVLSTLVFTLLIFPFNDLSDLVSAKVSQLTQGQVSVQFESLGLSLLPQPGLSLDNVIVEGAGFPTLSAEKISVAPNLLSLLAFKPGVSLAASGMFGGDVKLSTSPDKSTEKNSNPQKISLETSDVELSKFFGAMQSSFTADGRLNMSSSGVVDLNFLTQPQGEFELSADNVKVPVNNVQTPLGPLALPDFNLKSVRGNGDLKNGKLSIKKLTIGEAGDEVAAQLTGTLDLQISRGGGGVMTRPGAYDLRLQLQTKPSFQTKASFFLTFLKSFQKSESASGTTYSVRIAGPNFYSPPRMSPE